MSSWVEAVALPFQAESSGDFNGSFPGTKNAGFVFGISSRISVFASRTSDLTINWRLLSASGQMRGEG